jgi:hypothetical protein
MVRNAMLPVVVLTLAATSAHAQTVAVFPGTPTLRHADIEIAAQRDSLDGAVVVRAKLTQAAREIELALPVSTVQVWLEHDPVRWIDAQGHDSTESGLTIYPGEVLEGPTGGLFLGVRHTGHGIEYHLLVRDSEGMLVRILAADEALALAYALRHAVHLAEAPQG